MIFPVYSSRAEKQKRCPPVLQDSRERAKYFVHIFTKVYTYVLREKLFDTNDCTILCRKSIRHGADDRIAYIVRLAVRQETSDGPATTD